jgi:2-methylcitrate dehydratase PrpD
MAETNNIETQITRVSEWVVGLRYEDLPDSIVSLARLQILDILAGICAGARSAAGIRIRRAVLRTASPGPCTILPDGERVSLFDAVYLHAALANALELDNLVFMGHVGQSTVTVPLALAEMLGTDAKTALLAQVAAVEVSGRMGAYFATGPQQGHMRAYLHRTAGAVAAAKIIGLDRDRTALALAIALSMPEFPLYPAAFSPETKVICTSAPSVEGVRAAFLAAEGLDAALDVLEHPAGFWAYLSYLKTVPQVWAHVGETWSLDALSCKIYAACAYAQGPVAATLQLPGRALLKPDSIDHVLVRVPITTLVMESISEPHLGAGVTPVNTHFSTRRSVAATLIHGPLTGDFFAPGIFDASRHLIEELTRKIQLKNDWALSIDLIRGIDDALAGAGKPGPFGMSQTRRTFGKFNEAIGSQRFLTPPDIPAILRLPASDRAYLIRRIARGIRAGLPFPSAAARKSYVSFEQDLSKFHFRQSGRVEVVLKDGTVLQGECRVPPGFAGDPDRAARVGQKFVREAAPLCGESAAADVMKRIKSLPDSPIGTIAAALCRKNGGAKGLC